MLVSISLVSPCVRKKLSVPGCSTVQLKYNNSIPSSSTNDGWLSFFPLGNRCASYHLQLKRKKNIPWWNTFFHDSLSDISLLEKKVMSDLRDSNNFHRLTAPTFYNPITHKLQIHVQGASARSANNCIIFL